MAASTRKHPQPSSLGDGYYGGGRWEQVPERRPTMAEVRQLLRAVGEEQGVVVAVQENDENDEEQGLSSPLLGK
jgi:hypothetical protein